MLSLRHWRVLQAAAGSARSRAEAQAEFSGTARCITSLARISPDIASVPHDFFPVRRSKRGNLQVERVCLFGRRRTVTAGKVVNRHAEQVRHLAKEFDTWRTICLLEHRQRTWSDAAGISKRRVCNASFFAQISQSRSKNFA
nr:MAG TPA: hypothetical protein [Caudoviricetes sp.]